MEMSNRLNLLPMAEPVKIIFSSSAPRLVTISKRESFKKQ
jgi:hypothetical protein